MTAPEKVPVVAVRPWSVVAPSTWRVDCIGVAPETAKGDEAFSAPENEPVVPVSDERKVAAPPT